MAEKMIRGKDRFCLDGDQNGRVWPLSFISLAEQAKTRSAEQG